MSQKNRH